MKMTRLELSVVVLAISDLAISLWTVVVVHPSGVSWLWPPAVADQPLIQSCSIIAWISVAVLVGMSIHIKLRAKRNAT